MTIAAGTAATARVSEATRWSILIFCVICMVMIANLQYGWTLFVNPINKAHGWSIASIQVAFAIFIALETWLTPIEGWIVDMLGAQRGRSSWSPSAASWSPSAGSSTPRPTRLTMLYFGAVVSGIGGGAVYATSVGIAVKWFPDRRGLAVGLTAAGYGAGAALTVIPIRDVIDAYGYQTAFLWFGIIQGGVVFVLAWLLRGAGARRTGRGSAAEGRAVDAQLLAEGSADVAGVLAALHHVRHGVGQRPDGDGADRADRQGLQRRQHDPVRRRLDADRGADRRQSLQRRRAAAVRLGFRQHRPRIHHGDRVRSGRIAYWLLGSLGTAPWAFVIFAALIFLTWGEIFSLFPSTCTDTFGPKFATVNLSLLYTAKGTSAFLVPLANVIKSHDRQLAHGVRRHRADELSWWSRWRCSC